MNFLSILIVGLWYFGKRNIWNFLVILVLIAITGLALYQSALDNGTVDGVWWSGMWQNFATEMIGAILTFALFEILINANNRMEALIRQMASRDNATALNAVNELRADGYLFDGTLQHKSLAHANLSGANLTQANLSQTRLQGTDLSKADLSGSILKGADLQYASLEGASITMTQFDHRTILPDGSNWSTNRDMNEFIQPGRVEAVSTWGAIKRPTPHPHRALRAKRRKYS